MRRPCSGGEGASGGVRIDFGAVVPFCVRVDRQPNNPLHGVTLAAMLEWLVANIGWERMAAAVEIRCFVYEPSITSSLKFLRRVPWARAKVEEYYLRCRAELPR